MDIAAIVGVVVALVIVFVVQILDGGSPTSIILLPSMLLVFGGTFFAGMAGGVLKDSLGIGKLLKKAFLAKVSPPNKLVEDVVKLAERARREGLLALEDAVKTVEHPFLKRGLQLAIDGTDPEELHDILHAEVGAKRKADKAGMKIFESMGGYAPTIGIIGTVMGLVHVLENLNKPETLGHSIAAAFVATLWGVLSANVIWLPLAARLNRLSGLEAEEMELVIDGVLAIQAGSNPRLVAQKLRSLLPPDAARAAEAAALEQEGRVTVSSGGGVRRKKVRHEEHEEHVNHERWLVSYADMLTLLFVLFVVLYSMSSVDQKKFSELATSLSQGFGSQNVAITGNVSNLDGASQTTNIVPIDPGTTNPGNGETGTAGMTKEQVVAVERALRAADRREASGKARAATKEAEDLKAIEHKIADALERAKLLNQVKFTIDQRGLVVTVVTNEVVFAGNRADLQPGGEAILDAIAPTLAKLPNNIEVDGHTNQLKAATTFYPSGWELSAARASTTVRHLIAHGMAKSRMSAAAFSDTKPLIDPKDPRAVTMNRRVDVVVLTMLNAEQAALLPAAAGDDSKLHTGVTTAQAAAEAKAKAAAAAAESTGKPSTTHN